MGRKRSVGFALLLSLNEFMNPYRTIWLEPKRTFDQVANKTEQPLIVLPIIINGLAFAFDVYPGVNTLLDEADN